MTADSSQMEAEALPSGSERRQHPRYPHPELKVTINRVPVTPLDVSVGGLRVGIGGLKVGQKVVVALTSFVDKEPKAFETNGEIVSADKDRASLRFSSPTYALMRFVVHYLAHRHGVDPHIFR